MHAVLDFKRPFNCVLLSNMEIAPEIVSYMDHTIEHCTMIHALAETSGYGKQALSRIKSEPFAPTSPFQVRVPPSYEYDGREAGVVGMASDAKLLRAFSTGTSTIFAAAEQGVEAAVLAHLDAGWPIDYQSTRGWTALHHAALGGHANIVDVLLHRGATTDVATDEGKTALHIARRWKRHDVLALLIDHGADAHLTDADGARAFHRR
tara:strand:+ start:52 stop:672 length:621 start_codon:yes stop_codon:yes gene_type:complete